MDTASVYLHQFILALIPLGALALLIHTLTKHPCGDLSAPCGFSGETKRNLAFCKRQHTLWKWKLRFVVPDGTHADILLTMVSLGHKNFAELRHLIATQVRCHACSGGKVGMTELDRATRAYKSAADIGKQCTFRFKFLP